MSEFRSDQTATGADHTATGADLSRPEPTGHPAVDEVLASLEGLEDRPVGEHAAVFESAHDRLRAALTGDGQPAAGTPGT